MTTFKQFTKKQVEDISEHVAMHCRIGWAGIEIEEGRKIVRIELDFDACGNFLDHQALASLQSALLMLGHITTHKRALWMGFNNHLPQTGCKFKLWIVQ